MRVLVVDDEPLARKALQNVLEQRSDVDAFDCAVDAVQALDKLRECNYDVVLLDIAMPELSGLDLVDRLRGREQKIPAIVFVTAHDQHAVQAFEKRAVDYVLKPFSNDRIQQAIDVASQRSAAERAATLIEVLPQLQPSRKKAKLAIKSKGRILLIDPDEVSAVEAEGNYVLLQRKAGSNILRESISVVAEKLKPYNFIRIHRSVLVNASFVEELHPLFSGDYGLRMIGGKTYTVSRSYKKNLKDFASFWIGTEGFEK
jgi:DNA-binding LytR/AlgR family response regulator